MESPPKCELGVIAKLAARVGAAFFIVLAMSFVVLGVRVRAPALRLSVDDLHVGAVAADAYSGHVTVVLSSLTTAERVKQNVYFYRDDHYPTGRGEGQRFVHGFSNHLNDDLFQRGYAGRAIDVGAKGLRTVLLDDPSRGCVLVLGGILPATVRDATHDLLKDYIERGGLVIWAGGPFDALYAGAGANGPETADFSKWPQLFGSGVMEPLGDVRSPSLRFGLVPGTEWTAARIPFDVTTFGVVPARFRGPQPAQLGFVDNVGNSSVTAFALGRGHAVVFADGFDDEIVAADYVAQVLSTGAWAGPAGTQALGFKLGDAPLHFDVGSKVRSLFAFGWTAHDAPFAELEVDQRG
jgi:hypothetical protein